jgi:hypothetical protein
MPAIAALTMSAIMAVPHGPFDVRAVGNSETEKCAVIELCQRGNGLLDFLLALVPARQDRDTVCNLRIVAGDPVLPRGSVRLSE